MGNEISRIAECLHDAKDVHALGYDFTFKRDPDDMMGSTVEVCADGVRIGVYIGEMCFIRERSTYGADWRIREAVDIFEKAHRAYYLGDY